ncbi:MAG: pyridoxamine 5'-phosphate oxidase family protein [Rubrivivax sp.]|nr:pyridoxamine 5'-phosphate oxidase family protein [Rubrivivax sp.]
MLPKLPLRVAQYLQQHHVMTLASQGAEGPWAAAVFYANEGPELLFLSAPTSRHCRHLAQDPRCAATIQDDCSDWTQVQGIQLEGQVTQLQGESQARAQRLYGQKFPFLERAGAIPAAIAAALARVRWYRLQPRRLYFVDNSQGFGHRDEIELGRGAALPPA